MRDISGMMRVLLALILLSTASPALAAAQTPERCPDRIRTGATSERPRPLVVLVVTDPWAMVIGADSPRFALYSDGLVIYRNVRGYWSVRLNGEERRNALANLGIESLACFVGNHGNSVVTDQAFHNLFLGQGGPLSLVSAYAADYDPGGIPAPVRAINARLAAFDHPRARPWLPERIEVMIWPYEYAPDASIDWPADWPGLDSPQAVSRGENGYSLYLPGSEYRRLIAFLQTRRERGAVRIGGRKWAASVRFPFPMERMWMRPGAE